MSTSAAPYYPSMYYMVRSSPWINGVYGGPTLSDGRRTATFSVTVTAPSQPGNYAMYAYGRDNPKGGTCTGDSYNFANSGTFTLTVGNPTVLATTTTLPAESTTTTSIRIRTPEIPTTTTTTMSTTSVAPSSTTTTTLTSVAPTTTTPIYEPPVQASPTTTTLPDEPPATIPARPETVPDPAYVATDGEIEATIQVVDANEVPSLLSVQGRLVLTSGNFVKVRGKGFDRVGFAEVWLFSTPRLLGRVPKDDSGNFVGRVRIPEGVEEGEHTIELRAVTKRAKVVTVSVPAIVLGADDNSTDDTVATTVPTSPADIGTATTDDSDLVLQLDPSSAALEVEVTPAGGQPIVRSIEIAVRTEGTRWIWWLAVIAMVTTFFVWIVMRRPPGKDDNRRD